MMQLPVAIVLAFFAGVCGNHDQVQKRAIEWASYDAGIAGLNHVACVNTGVGVEPCRAFTSQTPYPLVLVCTKDDCIHVGFTTDATEDWTAKNGKYIPANQRTRIVPEP